MSTDIKKEIQSKKVKITISIIIIIAVAAAIFQAGIFVGFHKASFLYKSGDNFYRAFGNRDDRLQNGMGMMGGFKDEFSGGHGAIGKIVKVSLPTIVVVGPDNIEKVVFTDENTNVRNQRNVASINTLSVDQFITVLGTPNAEGQVVAKFIRIMPSPPPQIGGILGTSTSPIKNIK